MNEGTNPSQEELFVDVTTMDLLLTRCPNKHLHIYGFWGQITEEQKTVNMEAMTVTIRDECRDCGCEVRSSYGIHYDKRGLINGAGI